LLPSLSNQGGTFHKDFIIDFLVKELNRVRKTLGDAYPRLFVILGNDVAAWKKRLSGGETRDLNYCNLKRINGVNSLFTGTAYATDAIRLKDWERFDVTDYVRPGCIAPDNERAVFTVPIDRDELRSTTIEKDLQKLTGDENLETPFSFSFTVLSQQLDRADWTAAHR
jgi:hypothetical protein